MECEAREDSTAAMQLSPEFLAGSTKAGLEKIRTRLPLSPSGQFAKEAMKGSAK